MSPTLSNAAPALRLITSFSIGLLSVGCSVFGIRSEESPRYEVMEKDGSREIRQYSSMVIAKTKLHGEFRDAQNEGFRILANYIFGQNESREKISMTAPVTQTAASEKISMTAPVLQSKEGSESVMSFVMPAKYTLETLRKPKDERIQFEVIPPKTVAAIRYSGSWSEKQNEVKAQELVSWLSNNQNYVSSGNQQFAACAPLLTLAFLLSD